jgi:ketosteroid isomerase-like protein
MRIAILTVLLLSLLSPRAGAQDTQPVTADDPTAAIAQLRSELIDSFNKGDLDRLLSHLDPDVIVTWQNAEVCRGPEAVRAYYHRMMTGPDRVVESVNAEPTVTDRHVYDGTWAVSWGKMNDHFKLTDGRDLAMDSRFTATIARRGEVWKVTSFHVSVNAFDNPITGLAVSTAMKWVAIIAAAAALVVGFVGGVMIGRKRT